MKLKIYWILLCLVLSTSGITAQVLPSKHPNAEKSEIRSFLDKASKLQLMHKKQVDVNLVTGLNIYFWNESNWESETRVDLVYDEDRLLTRTVEIWTGTEWIVSEKKTLTYENGLLISELYEELNDLGELAPDERYLYEYEPGTNPAIINEMSYQWFNGVNWVNDYLDVFVVTNNMISEGTGYIWENNDWLEESHFMVVEESDTVTMTYESWTGSEWENMDRQIYPNLTIEELYEWSFSQDVLLEIPFFLMNFQVPDYLYQEWDGEEWVNSHVQSTSYYETPNELPESKYINTNYWDGDEWTPGSALKYYYNEKANPDSSDLSYFDHLYGTQEWRIFMKEHYTYNEEGLYDQVVALTDTSALGAEEPTGLVNLYKYQFEWNGVSTGAEEPAKPVIYTLNPAYPNPFNPTTNITYSLERAGEVKIQVYDILGRFVATLANGFKIAGEHQVQFEAGNLSSGLYMVRMEAAGYLKTQMVTLLK